MRFWGYPARNVPDRVRANARFAVKVVLMEHERARSTHSYAVFPHPFVIAVILRYDDGDVSITTCERVWTGLL